MEFANANLEEQIMPMSDYYNACYIGPSSLENATTIATDILTDIMQFRRMANSHSDCAPSCPTCSAPHLSHIISAIKENRPIIFILPAFPGKSPNLAKVLGPLPDMAEQRALEFLEHLCSRVKTYHSPGARVILCSDGRVFSDAVGIREEDVTAYQRELSLMIKKLSLTSISTFNLDDVYPGLGFDEMRIDLMRKYGRSIDNLKQMVKQGSKEDSVHENKEAHRLYCGITRFLFEDAMYPGQIKSRSWVQKDSRIRSYEVIQRSNAWSELISKIFPDAVRLSIHPQVCGAKKLGISLVGTDNWMTPWHGVAVDVGGRFKLLKRAQAEALGAKLVHLEGRPSHYTLIEKSEMAFS
jgi:pyoverdine/dityrosine biosynthesis protein Dit1